MGLNVAESSDAGSVLKFGGLAVLQHALHPRPRTFFVEVLVLVLQNCCLSLDAG